MSEREPRFPGIDWWCDVCDAFLNDQKGFDDHHYVWKCRECGYKNSISADAIVWESKVGRFFGSVLGYMRSLALCVLFGSILGIANAGSVGVAIFLYIILDIISMIFEKGIMKYCYDMTIFKYIVTTPFANLIVDFKNPFTAVRNMFTSIIRYAKHKKMGFLFSNVISGVCYLPIAIGNLGIVIAIIILLINLL